MNNYITGATIKALREQNGMTQQQLAEKLAVSDKTISKWETGKGFPDISLIEPLSAALRVSVPELLSGEQIINANRAANMQRSSIYVCPICGNIIHATGSAMISCCGVTLPAIEPEETDAAHEVSIEILEHELYITTEHPMTKEHYVSFVAYVTGDRFEMVKLYPEGNVDVRFFKRGHGWLYWYCNRHGLYRKRV